MRISWVSGMTMLSAYMAIGLPLSVHVPDFTSMVFAVMAGAAVGCSET